MKRILNLIICLTAITAIVPVFADTTTCNGVVRQYESATGTVTQNGTPTPTNPIEPVFYQQGDIVLRKVGSYADSYDSTTGKITRRVGVRVLDGTENFLNNNPGAGKFDLYLQDGYKRDNILSVFTHFKSITASMSSMVGNNQASVFLAGGANSSLKAVFCIPEITSLDRFKSWVAEQYANGTPVTVYYPLATEVTEDWTETTYCDRPITIATTKYTEDAFAGLVATLNSAIDKVTNIVDDTVQQATEIGVLAETKQDRPDTDCPAGRKCLLIMGADNKPHWYLIQE